MPGSAVRLTVFIRAIRNIRVRTFGSLRGKLFAQINKKVVKSKRKLVYYKQEAIYASSANSHFGYQSTQF
jgi:hypothetical protein